MMPKGKMFCVNLTANMQVLKLSFFLPLTANYA